MAQHLIPRPEYPRPQMVRDAFLNLNGAWDFSFDFSNSGIDRKYQLEENFERTITVPFCPESKLSGIGFTDFIPALWYKRTFTLPEEALNGHVLLHFGAVDYRCKVWVNDVECGGHQGGYTSFAIDITEAAKAGENKVVLWAEDDGRSCTQPRGKQSSKYYSHGCDYTRTTGIWQTVWIEWVPSTYIDSYRVIPDRRNGKVTLKASIKGCTKNAVLTASASFDGKETGVSAVKAGPCTILELPLSIVELWEPGHPALYDLKLTLKGESYEDTVTGYFGLRDVEVRPKGIYLNGKPVYQRLVLDQGFYPDGIYTAPTDEDLKADITRCQDLGFNGARLHQKVFEPRFLYWADHLGYLCWGEYPSWGINLARPEALSVFLHEWMESVDRDFNHPAIVGWCPLNETGVTDRLDTTEALYLVTKHMDPTRPVIDTSGYCHWGQTDVYDIHDYEQDPVAFKEHYAHLDEGVSYYLDPGDQLLGRQDSLFRQRIRRDLVEPRCFRRLGLRPAAQIREGSLRPLLRPDQRFDGEPQDLRFLLHPALRRGAGAERPVPLRPKPQVLRGDLPPHPGDQSGRRRYGKRISPSPMPCFEAGHFPA